MFYVRILLQSIEFQKDNQAAWLWGRTMDNHITQISKDLHQLEHDHDPDTLGHEIRVGKLMSYLAKAIGCSRFFCEALEIVGGFHDIGKLNLPSELLNKNGPLSQSERKLIQTHPISGYNIVTKIRHPYKKLAEIVTLTHHEAYNGSGYPRGLKENQIPLPGRICTICDVYDALRSYRSYQHKRYSHQEVLSIMQDKKKPHGLGNKVDPVLFKVFVKISSQYAKIYDCS